MDEECPRCKNPQMSFYTLQLRSVDEGSTVFYKCLKCGYVSLCVFHVDIRILSTTDCSFILACFLTNREFYQHISAMKVVRSWGLQSLHVNHTILSNQTDRLILLLPLIQQITYSTEIKVVQQYIQLQKHAHRSIGERKASTTS